MLPDTIHFFSDRIFSTKQWIVNSMKAIEDTNASFYIAICIIYKIRKSVGITRESRKKSLNIESSLQLFLTELGSLGVHDTQKQVEFVERHEGKTRRSRFVVG